MLATCASLPGLYPFLCLAAGPGAARCACALRTLPAAPLLIRHPLAAQRLLENMVQRRFKVPTPIQKSAVPVIAKGARGPRRAACRCKRCAWATARCLLVQKVCVGHSALPAGAKGARGPQRAACWCKRCAWATARCLPFVKGVRGLQRGACWCKRCAWATALCLLVQKVAWSTARCPPSQKVCNYSALPAGAKVARASPGLPPTQPSPAPPPATACVRVQAWTCWPPPARAPARRPPTSSPSWPRCCAPRVMACPTTRPTPHWWCWCPRTSW